MSKHYKQALSILSAKSFDAQQVCLRLAQEHPALFVQLTQMPAVFSVPAKDHGSQDKSIRFNLLIQELAEKQRIFGEDRVGYIKWIREVSGIGLKEAKDVADAVRDGYKVWIPSFERYLEARDCQIIGLDRVFLMERIRHYTR
jgi:hypothetical protein